jgi:hypothetical protein
MSEKMKESLSRLIRKILPSCKDITELVSKSWETKLSWHENLKLKHHLWVCEPCSRYLSNLKFIKRVFEIEEPKTPVLSRDASERIKNALKSPKSLLIFVVINCYL